MSSAPETSIQVADDPYKHGIPFITTKKLTLTKERTDGQGLVEPSHAMRRHPRQRPQTGRENIAGGF